MGISRIFDLSRRSMASYQRALDITAHNVANASNPQYSRQRAIITTELPEISGGFVWGTGIKLDAIQRVRDNLTDVQLRTNYQNFSKYSKQAELLSHIETLFTEPSELGLGNLISSFFNSWEELAVTPNSTILRSNVIQAAQKISSKVSSVNEGLKLAKSDLLNDLKSDVQKLNTYLNQVQQLNRQIFETENIGNNAADLLDKRDQVLDELNKLVNCNITFDDKKAAIVSVGGVFAADRTTVVQFSISEINGRLSLVSDNGGAVVNLNSGEIAAISDVYSKYIPEYLSKIDSIMSSLVDAVNSVHVKGYTIHAQPKTGIKFFEDYKDGSLRISEEILNDPKYISISEDSTDGNGNIAIKIAQISDNKILNGATLSENYASLISIIGNDVLSSFQYSESSELIVQQLENQRASTSGVSIDEEMANVIKFQKTYDASAKLIQIANELLETLINMV